MTTNDSYMKAEITFLADFLHHHFGKLFFFKLPPSLAVSMWHRVFSLEATVRKSDFMENGSAISLTWRSAFRHALKFRPPDSPVFPISRREGADQWIPSMFLMAEGFYYSWDGPHKIELPPGSSFEKSVTLALTSLPQSSSMLAKWTPCLWLPQSPHVHRLTHTCTHLKIIKKNL